MPYRTASENRIERLFHYQPYRAAHVENTICRGVIRFARACEFNDPWDCKPSFHVPDDPGALYELVHFLHRSSQRRDPSLNEGARAIQSERFRQRPNELRRAIEQHSAEMWALMDIACIVLLQSQIVR